MGQMNKTETQYIQKLMAKAKTNHKPEVLKLDIDSMFQQNIDEHFELTPNNTEFR